MFIASYRMPRTIFKCPGCDYECNNKKNYAKHLERKYKCSNIDTNALLQELYAELDKTNLRPHPIHTEYYASEHNEVFGPKTNKPIGYQHDDGYYVLGITKRKTNQNFTYLKHIFIYECFNGIVDSNIYEIDHIDSDKSNNNLANLQKLTKVEHAKKTAKNRSGTTSAGEPIIRYQIDENGDKINITDYKSIESAKKETGWSKIQRAVSNKKIYYNFYWEKIINEDFSNEEWRTIDDEKLKTVQISNMGRIKWNNGRISTGYINDAGYSRTSINRTLYQTHRLVCIAFHGPPPSDHHTVDHIDNDRNNNKADNLRWATRREQRINSSSVRKITAYKDGKLYKVWNTITEAYMETKVNPNCIGECANNVRLSAGGYTWKFYEE